MMRLSKPYVMSTSLCRVALAFFMVLGMLAVAPVSQAQTSDGMTPAEETVCDGQTGALWGLCVAYCEAMDCDYPGHHASQEACDRVLANYTKKSGGELPPCCLSTEEGDGSCDGGGDGGSEGGSGSSSGNQG